MCIVSPLCMFVWYTFVCAFCSITHCGGIIYHIVCIPICSTSKSNVTTRHNINLMEVNFPIGGNMPPKSIPSI